MAAILGAATAITDHDAIVDHDALAGRQGERAGMDRDSGGGRVGQEREAQSQQG